MNAKNLNYLLLGSSLVVLLFLFLSLAQLSSKMKNESKQASSLTNKNAAIAKSSAEILDPNRLDNLIFNIEFINRFSQGENLAAVTLIAFYDFQCEYSKEMFLLFQKMIPLLPFKVRYEIRNMPLQEHAFSLKAAQASLAAGKQGKYWEMVEKLFWNQKDLNLEKIKSLAASLNLNLKLFEEDLENPQLTELIQTDLNLAQKYGLEGTPSFFINGRLIGGAYAEKTLLTILNMAQTYALEYVAKNQIEMKNFYDHLIQNGRNEGLNPSAH